MNPGRFYIPRMGISMNPMMGTGYLPTRGGLGLFGRIANSFKTFNWSGLLNGANKTLNVVNQTIPLVRQAGPMFNNMKSMLRIARAFGSQTNNTNSTNKASNRSLTNINTHSNVINDNEKNLNLEKEVSNSSYPNFFV